MAEGAGELLRLAEANRAGCLICRLIVEANRGFEGRLKPLKIGALTLDADSQLLHLRGCTARIPPGKSKGQPGS